MEAIIYSTIYLPPDISLKKINLIKELIITNETCLSHSYEVGIVIPFYNRYNYVRYCLKSIEESCLDHKLIFLFFDDGSTDKDLLKLLETCSFPHTPIIKIFCNRVNLVDQRALNTYMPGSAYPYTLRFGTDILYRLGCKLVMHMDSDAVVSYNWINSLKQLYHKYNDPIKLISGFNSNNHKILQTLDTCYIKATIGGLGILFDEHTYQKRIRKYLDNHAYDWQIMDDMSKHNEKFYCTRPSVIQHIGLVSTMIRNNKQENDVLAPYFAVNNTNVAGLLKYINSLGKTSQNNKNFDYALDFAGVSPPVPTFDIVIVAHSKDRETLHLLLESIQKYISRYRHIYLVACENFAQESSVIFIPESQYPFSKDEIVIVLRKKGCPEFKIGWYYQQLLKLYAHFAIENLTDNFAVIDADVVFLNNFCLFDTKNKPIFTVGYGHHSLYFEHMNRLLPRFTKLTKFSGISHHMVFNKHILNSLFFRVETFHKKAFWRSFLDCLQLKTPYICASEYEIYFNYVLKYFNGRYLIRKEKWVNVKTNDVYNQCKKEGYVYDVYHDSTHNDDKTYRIE